MPESLKANNDPVNQLAAKKLQELEPGVLNESKLYALQLMNLVLHKNKVELHWRADNLPHLVGVLINDSDQDRVNQWLLGNYDLMTEIDSRQSPEVVAATLLEHLQTRLVSELPGYPL